MKVDIVEKKSFAVIGKLGQGYADQGSQWIPPLWEATNKNFHEIEGLAKYDQEGNMVGSWGAMSDIDDSFHRWSDQGKYLAGCEADLTAVAPEGWTKWVIPSYRFLVVKCNRETYGQIFQTVINSYMPDNNYELAGAVHEFYLPKEKDGSLYLFFPIQKL